jgi:hypothetical protein
MITKIVLNKDGVDTQLSPDQWKALPLTDRVAAMGANAVHFFAGAQELSSREALAALKAS